MTSACFARLFGSVDEPVHLGKPARGVTTSQSIYRDAMRRGVDGGLKPGYNYRDDHGSLSSQYTPETLHTLRQVKRQSKVISRYFRDRTKSSPTATQ